ncbi:unnamed protein product, partial [Urochloa humidicola]
LLSRMRTGGGRGSPAVRRHAASHGGARAGAGCLARQRARAGRRPGRAAAYGQPRRRERARA